MKTQRLDCFGIATAFAAAIPLRAQIQALYPSGIRPSSVTGAPYCGTRTTERIQTLANGTHITQPGQRTVICRDSVGRTREEFAFRGLTGDRPAPVMVTIVDPVAGFRYQLNSNDKVAQRFTMPAPPRAPTAQPTAAMAFTPSTAAGVIVSGKMVAPFGAAAGIG